MRGLAQEHPRLTCKLRLKNGVEYRDLGADHISRNDKTKSLNRLLRKIENLDFQVTGIREKRAA